MYVSVNIDTHAMRTQRRSFSICILFIRVICASACAIRNALQGNNFRLKKKTQTKREKEEGGGTRGAEVGENDEEGKTAR